MTTTQLTIDAVEQQFEQWRSNKQPREQIPVYLWNLVQQLMDFYSPGTIIKRLKLSTKQMRSKGLLPLKNNISQEEAPFVDVKLPPPPLLTHPSQLTIERADGTRLSCINLSNEQFALSIKTFLNAACK